MRKLFAPSPGAVAQRCMVMIGLFSDSWLSLAARPRSRELVGASYPMQLPMGRLNRLGAVLASLVSGCMGGLKENLRVSSGRSCKCLG